MVLCKRRPDAEYRLYSIGTYGNAALALVQADYKTVITSERTQRALTHFSRNIIYISPSRSNLFLSIVPLPLSMTIACRVISSSSNAQMGKFPFFIIYKMKKKKKRFLPRIASVLAPIISMLNMTVF